VRLLREGAVSLNRFMAVVSVLATVLATALAWLLIYLR
jgi:hypothetical protein